MTKLIENNFIRGRIRIRKCRINIGRIWIGIKKTAGYEFALKYSGSVTASTLPHCGRKTRT
jgi:hypothetical protein